MGHSTRSDAMIAVFVTAAGMHDMLVAPTSRQLLKEQN